MEVNENMKFRTRSTHGVCKYSFRILETMKWRKKSAWEI